jgi:hypothetical protein
MAGEVTVVQKLAPEQVDDILQMLADRPRAEDDEEGASPVG